MIARSCVAEGREVFIIAIENETDPACVENIDHVWLSIAAFGAVLDTLKQHACTDVVMIGRVERPDFAKLKPDLRGALLLPKLIRASKRGDDALLSVALAELEKAGLNVVAAEDVLSALVANAGLLSARAPADGDRRDIALGREVLHTLGDLDVGQAVVVRHGRVLAVEAAEGTDRMIARCADFAGAEAAGVLVKAPKSAQERRVDLPTVGADTLRNAAAAGLAGLAVEADGVLLVDREEMIRLSDEHGMFFIVMAADNRSP